MRSAVRVALSVAMQQRCRPLYASKCRNKNLRVNYTESRTIQIINNQNWGRSLTALRFTKLEQCVRLTSCSFCRTIATDSLTFSHTSSTPTTFCDAPRIQQTFNLKLLIIRLHSITPANMNSVPASSSNISAFHIRNFNYKPPLDGFH